MMKKMREGKRGKKIYKMNEWQTKHLEESQAAAKNRSRKMSKNKRSSSDNVN